MEQQVLLLLAAIKPEFIWGVCIMAIAVLLVKFASDLMDTVISYFLFIGNKNLGKNVEVNVDGLDGYIAYFDKTFIYIRLICEENIYKEYLIPMKRWRASKWIVKRVKK